MKIILAAAGIVAFGLFPTGVLGGEMRQTVLKFSDLSGWASDDHADALRVFRITCGRLKSENWKSVCEKAKTVSDAKSFFEDNFVPVLVEDGAKPLFTGYFEPELLGSRKRRISSNTHFMLIRPRPQRASPG